MCRARGILAKYAHARTITEVDPVEQGEGPRHGQFDTKVLGKTVSNASEFRKELLNRTVKSVDRHGKYLWINLSDTKRRTPVFHFGMTGALVVRGGEKAEYKRFSVDASEKHWPPKFCKLQLTFNDGTQIAFVNSRRLGGVWFAGKTYSISLLSS